MRRSSKAHVLLNGTTKNFHVTRNKSILCAHNTKETRKGGGVVVTPAEERGWVVWPHLSIYIFCFCFIYVLKTLLIFLIFKNTKRFTNNFLLWTPQTTFQMRSSPKILINFNHFKNFTKHTQVFFLSNSKFYFLILPFQLAMRFFFFISKSILIESVRRP